MLGPVVKAPLDLSQMYAYLQLPLLCGQQAIHQQTV